MRSRRFYEWVFLTGAVWNGVAAAVLVVGGDRLRAALGMGPALDPLMSQLFAMSVVLFGIGYWIVGRNLDRNHGIVLMGILGKAAVFALFLGHALAGHVPFATIAPAAVDLAYGVLFVSFYARRKTILG